LDLSKPYKGFARPSAKAKMALTIYTVGAKNACYEALANLGVLAKLASDTKSGWDFHVTAMIDHVKSAMSQLDSSPAQAGTHLERAINTLGMLRKIDPVRLNDIQKGSLKQLIGYVAKSLRDARANIKVVTTASRPGVKAKMSKTEAVEDVVNALYIAERKIQAMMQEGQRGNLSLVKKDIDYLRGVSAAIKQRIEKFESTGFSRPGVKAKFADAALNQIRNNAAISDKILTLVSKGLSVPQAIDSVLGEGTYKRIGSEVYDELKKRNTKKASTDFDLAEACWEGYEAVGTKKKDGKTVPNCVPKKKAARPGVKAKMAAEIASDPRDKDFEKLKTLKGVVHQGKGFYIIPGKLMTPERRTKVKRSTQRYELSNMGDLVGWGTNHPNVNDYRLKDWAEAFA
jgi:hypothetical protein